MIMPPVSMIVAMTHPGGVIGSNGEMPWRLPRDMRRFVKLTRGRAVVMGPKTYKSIGQPLQGRLNIILTTNQEYQAPAGVLVVHAPRQALELAAINNYPELSVIGGALVYASFLKFAETLFVTYVESEAEGDTHFPYWDKGEWYEAWAEKKFLKEEGDAFPTRFAEYRKRLQPPPEKAQTTWRLPGDTFDYRTQVLSAAEPKS